MEKKIRISGMTCAHCEQSIKQVLLKHSSINSVSVSHKTGFAYLKGNRLISNKDINQLILPLGYEIEKEQFPWSYIFTLTIGLGLFIGFQYLYGRFNFDPTQFNLSIGLVVGYGVVSSLHCVSMCGGIALSASLNQKNRAYFKSILKYQSGRLISYTLSGLVLGLVGSVFEISNQFKNILLLGAGIWLIILSLQMANIIQLPDIKWTKRFKSNSSFGIGLLNGLMPCGALQTMQIVALSSSSPFTGALMMLVFGLVTSPALIGMQWLGMRLTQVKAKTIKLASSMIVLLLGLQMVTQSPIMQNSIDHIFRDVKQAPIVNGIQYVELTIVEGRYVLDYNTVEEGIPVVLSFDHTQFLGCANPIILSFLDNQVIDVLKDPEPVQFIPTQEELRIHCWMDMDTITLYVRKAVN